MGHLVDGQLCKGHNDWKAAVIQVCPGPWIDLDTRAVEVGIYVLQTAGTSWIEIFYSIRQQFRVLECALG